MFSDGQPIIIKSVWKFLDCVTELLPLLALERYCLKLFLFLVGTNWKKKNYQIFTYTSSFIICKHLIRVILYEKIFWTFKQVFWKSAKN